MGTLTGKSAVLGDHQGLRVGQIERLADDRLADRGRIKRVYIQGDTNSRMLPDDLGDWYVRNSSGTMVPFTAFAHGNWSTGSPQLERYNGVPSLELLGVPEAAFLG